MATTPDINKILRNYNAKIRRLKKKEKNENIKIPNPINKKTFIAYHPSKKEQGKALRDLQKFLKRGAEIKDKKGISFYEKEIFKAEKRRAKNKLAKEIESYNRDVRILGKSQGYPKKMLMDNRYENLIAKQEKLKNLTLKNIKTSEEFKTGLGFLRNQTKTRQQLFRENYYNMLITNANMSGFSMDKVKDIIQKLDKVNNTKFYDMYNDDEGLKLFLENYHFLLDNLSKARYTSEDFNNMYVYLDELYNNIDRTIENYI